MFSKEDQKFGKKVPSIFKTVSSVPKSFCLKNIASRKSISKGFNCYKCDRSLPSYSEMVLHLKLIHNACASYDCSKLSDFKMHSSVCVNRGFGCAICNKNFSEKYLLLAHFYEHIDAAVYACKICREGFQLKIDLQKHLLHVHDKNVSLSVMPSHSKTVYQKCGHCSKYFSLFAEFVEHVSTCNTSTYACSVCQVIFPTLSDLDEHRLVEHKLEHAIKGHEALKQGKRYFCGICYLGFFKGNTLKKHVITHEIDTSFICDVCYVTFASDNDLQLHYLQHIEEHYALHDLISQHSCNSCMKTFKTQKDLKDHLTVKNCKNKFTDLSNEVQVKKFNSTFEDAISSSNSKKSAKMTSENDSNDSHDCVEFQENVPFDTSEVPVYALKCGEEILNCDDSRCVVVMDLVSLFVLQRGICASESRIPDFTNCEAYNENDVIDASFLQEHMYQILTANNENRVSNSEQPSNLLDIESSCFEQDLNTNSETLSAVSNDDSIKFADLENDESLPVVECESFVNPDISNEAYDVLNFSTAESLINNSEGLSASDIIFKAKISSFDEHANSETVNSEKKLILNDNDKFSINNILVCNICKQVFSSKISLSLHVKGYHAGFNCYQCWKSFCSEEELKNHEKLHQSLFECNLCEASYSDEILLKKHQHNSHEDMKLFCYICKRRYTSKDEFRKHILIHNGEVPTKCDICGKMYTTVRNYIKHRVSHENERPAKKLKVHQSL